MARLTFFPIGNADSTLIELNDERMILVDFCDENRDDGRIPLGETLKAILKKKNRNWFDVVAFTHADDDHVHGAEDFFWLDYAKKYQDDNRIKIKELWVPACFILDDDAGTSAWAIRQEARYRLKCGTGIRVFGEPSSLSAWLRSQNIDPATRQHLIFRAGKCLPGFGQFNGGVEIFLHSPFSARMDEDNSDRNGNSIVLHLTFFEDSYKMRCMLGADAEYDSWVDIVTLTRMHYNDERLSWDLFHVSHHCSYTGLSNEKGTEETKPLDEIQYMFDQGGKGCILVSPSQKIPSVDTTQPPHFQTAAFYKLTAKEKSGEFIVTMDWPVGTEKPIPVVVETTQGGFKVIKDSSSVRGSNMLISQPSPRFGCSNDR